MSNGGAEPPKALKCGASVRLTCAACGPSALVIVGSSTTEVGPHAGSSGGGSGERPGSGTDDVGERVRGVPPLHDVAIDVPDGLALDLALDVVPRGARALGVGLAVRRRIPAAGDNVDAAQERHHVEARRPHERALLMMDVEGFAAGAVPDRLTAASADRGIDGAYRAGVPRSTDRS